MSFQHIYTIKCENEEITNVLFRVFSAKMPTIEKKNDSFTINLKHEQGTGTDEDMNICRDISESFDEFLQIYCRLMKLLKVSVQIAHQEHLPLFGLKPKNYDDIYDPERQNAHHDLYILTKQR